jgi:hypothetical protein
VTEIAAEVVVDLRGLGRYKRALNDEVRARSRGPVRDAMTQWAARYRGFAQKRFAKFSRGGGDWAPFSPNTRRKRGSMSSASLLRDTGLLFAALEAAFTGQPGAVQQDIPFGVRAGFGGPGRYPNGVSIADVAMFHQTGAGTLPERRIIVTPDVQTLAAMRRDMDRALKKLSDESGTG